LKHQGRSSGFDAHVYEIVRAIPAGRVMTYGSIAALIPPPSGTLSAGYVSVRARWVGYAIAVCPDDVPWQRVINSRGRVSKRPGFGPKIQRKMLEAEGVEFDKADRVDLSVYRWEPSVEWLQAHGLPPGGLQTPGRSS
jgi:methylated-DNA-protein-cysteine methyltransferase-like protein